MPRPHHFASPGAFAQAVRFEARLRSRRAGMELAVRRAGCAGRPLVVGPWVSEIGFEVLYWIPFLRRLFERHGIRPEQVTAISRGGVAGWYAGVADGYVDILDLVDVEEYRRGQHERVAEAGEQKQYLLTSLDHEIWHRAQLEGSRVHPLVMYSRLRYFWGREEGLDALERLCLYRPFPDPGLPDFALPDRFVAAKPYFSSCFPETPKNRRFVGELIARLAETVDVVLLTTGLRMDDHAEFRPAAGRVHSLDGTLPARDNLGVQTRVIARAQSLLSTYGGPSYLGPALGVPSVSFFSAPNHNPVHLQAAEFAARRLGMAPPLVVNAGDADAPVRIETAVARPEVLS